MKNEAISNKWEMLPQKPQLRSIWELIVLAQWFNLRNVKNESREMLKFYTNQFYNLHNRSTISFRFSSIYIYVHCTLYIIQKPHLAISWWMMTFQCTPLPIFTQSKNPLAESHSLLTIVNIFSSQTLTHIFMHFYRAKKQWPTGDVTST